MCAVLLSHTDCLTQQCNGVDVDTFGNNMFWLVLRAVIVARDLVHKICYFLEGVDVERDTGRQANKQTRARMNERNELKVHGLVCIAKHSVRERVHSTHKHNHTWNHTNRGTPYV